MMDYRVLQGLSVGVGALAGVCLGFRIMRNSGLQGLHRRLQKALEELELRLSGLFEASACSIHCSSPVLWLGSYKVDFG